MIPFRLYVISDRRRMGIDPVATALAALTGHQAALQWREKDLPESALRPDLERLRPHLAPEHLFLNGAVDLAAELGLSVHLPESGITVTSARERLGPNARVGRSVHSLASALEAARAGADFVTFGPVYDTPSKRLFGPPQGIARLAEVCTSCPLPVFALGGVTLARVDDCRSAGAFGIAAIGAIWDAPDPSVAIAAFQERLLPWS
ncbi:MAG: thiamine phosphate synthase [Candidatus Eisenbacteria bacterium]|nr:thiamine phosphate synthase [Candidatus Eisenbacteria bacterium]MCC7143441.1 thiamine phosphate synthase [Candidatus Eisenbacteria bacterium]